jgi:hypothetical protein
MKLEIQGRSRRGEDRASQGPRLGALILSGINLRFRIAVKVV